MSRVRVLLSGGIGAGKSEVGRLLARRGARAIDADRVGHEVLNQEAFSQVAERWPRAVGEDGVDRGRLAEEVFADPEQLLELEAITHPHIRRRILEEVERSPEEVVVVEVPLMEDFLGDGWVRVVVDCPEEMRVERLRARGMGERAIRARIRAQPGRGEWQAWADHVVDNSGDREDLHREVDRLWSRVTGRNGSDSIIH